MEKRDNYAIASANARRLFSDYDQEAIIRKLKLEADETYIYTALFGERYRIRRSNADMERFLNGQWVEANSFGEVLTMLDLVCCCREDRFLRGKWKNMLAFGLQFHTNLMEDRNPTADFFEHNAPRYAAACEAFGGRKFPQGDLSYTFEVFDGLGMTVQLWFGDDEFPAQIRYLWDENADMYIKYETMYYAVGLWERRIRDLMG